jgi:hypothetical protein
MKKKVLILTIVAVLLALAPIYLWGPSQSPPGQTPLTTLSASNFTEFSAAFDSQADSPRLVLLVSPT